jgi:mitogen-activated protein kinase 1/3
MAEQLPNWALGSRYCLTKKLGAGSYGNVYEALDKKTGSKVAIKQVSGIFKDIADARRMLREISILHKLSHPNVIKVLDILLPINEPKPSCCFLVLEHVETDLKSFLQQQNLLTDD